MKEMERYNEDEKGHKMRKKKKERNNKEEK